MKFTPHTLPALFAINFFIYLTVRLVESQHVPRRCRCPIATNQIQGPFLDVTVTLKGRGCMKDEITVLLKKGQRNVCLSPHGPQGTRLLKCWSSKKEGEDKKKCIKALRRRTRRRRVKSKKIKT